MSNQGKGKSIWKNYRFPILLIGSIVVGSVIGMVMGEKATVLKPFGDIFLNLMFTAIVPLVFATIASAVGNMMNMKRLSRRTYRNCSNDYNSCDDTSYNKDKKHIS